MLDAHVSTGEMLPKIHTVRIYLTLIAVGICTTICCAQEPSTQPYAAIDRNSVSYNGPGRDVGHDLIGPDVRIGLLAPLAGPQEAEGVALRRAAELAIEDENAVGLPGGVHLRLVVRDESGPWGQAATEIAHMTFDDNAVALITSADGASAHLAEQVANKIGVPVLTLASDVTTTEINLPWIFRLGATDAAQARAFARDIYSERKLQRVLLVTEDDHDGRAGGEAFEKAAAELGAVVPTRIGVPAPAASVPVGASGAGPVQNGAGPSRSGVDGGPNSVSGGLDGAGGGRNASGGGPNVVRPYVFPGAQAVVFWTDAATAEPLVARARAAMPAAPFYLCRKAVQAEGNARVEHKAARRPRESKSGGEGGIWIAEPAGIRSDRSAAFAQAYRHRFGAEPGPGAAEAYDAVRVLAVSLRHAGPNRARLRDALAGVTAFPGASGVISFDHAGNDTSPITLSKLK